jgi:hypothetical protein
MGGLKDVGEGYLITVEHAGREAAALVGPLQVEDWLANHGAAHPVTGTVRALLHALIREVLDEEPR